MPEKYIALILHCQFFANVTRKVGVCVASFWATYPKMNTNLRKAIAAVGRLMLTMQFLTSGDSQVSLPFLFRMGKKNVSRIVSDTSEAIAPFLF